MPNVVPSFPFPARNPAFPRVEDVIFVADYARDSGLNRLLLERSQGDEARLLRLQYLGIEGELERAFRYVSPAAENAGAFSLKFAEVIRSAANAYEIICKSLYSRFYN